MSYPPGPPDNDDSVPEQPNDGPPSYDPPRPPPSPYDPPPSGYGQPPYSAEYGYGQPPPTNGKATIALIVGITSLVLSPCCLGIIGVVAVVLGVKARNEISSSGGRQAGDGMALAGIITGAVAVLISLALFVLIVGLIATGNTDFDQRMYDTSY